MIFFGTLDTVVETERGQPLTLDILFDRFIFWIRVMARPLRIKYEGAFYHITARGNERKKIFFLKLIMGSLKNT